MPDKRPVNQKDKKRPFVRVEQKKHDRELCEELTKILGVRCSMKYDEK